MSSASEAGPAGGVRRPLTAAFDADPGAEAARPVAAERATSRAWALTRSAAVVVLLALLLFFLVPRPTSTSQPAVDVAAAGSVAARDFPSTPAVPRGLPVTWTPTEAGLQNARDGVLTWRVTYRTPSGGWIGVRQGTSPSRSWEDLQVINGIPAGIYHFDRHPWVQRDRGDRLMRNLVTRSAGLTTVVSGTGPESELITLIQALPPDALGTPLPESPLP